MSSAGTIVIALGNGIFHEPHDESELPVVAVSRAAFDAFAAEADAIEGGGGEQAVTVRGVVYVLDEAVA